ncbi:MAG TPA: hypothetical protein VMB18_07410 [Terriglobales bacterium]|nr:hypothetical protein [Terriglobales bacterium]HUK47978.1 hypothetical protein [Terriglobales bacterium]
MHIKLQFWVAGIIFDEIAPSLGNTIFVPLDAWLLPTNNLQEAVAGFVVLDLSAFSANGRSGTAAGCDLDSDRSER